MFSFTVTSLSELSQVANEMISHFENTKIFAFYGELGAGKTTLIKSICQSLHVTDEVTSPTFSLVYEYGTAKNELIYHFDFYRINSVEEIFDIGFEEYLYSGNYCFIEWPAIIAHLLPPEAKNIAIERKDQDVREIIMH